MEIVPEVSPDFIPQEKASPGSELCSDSKGVENKPEDSTLPSTSQVDGCLQIHAKKQTRQWAAWTRQEEESFFSALRQVGKNFEKITSRVQSKNKDQVRHYYYRLVRRMNKLLGPELCLDAKNSKDTNAAMLRWWSLLEKYSCKASKLHLKPRRFKIFVETLENQLLRDRKKSVKRRVSTVENNSSIQKGASADQIQIVGHENRAVKIFLVDGQNIQKVGPPKGPLFKRPASIGATRTNYKPESSAVKTSTHRRKTAAYKKWEKAAMAGVSLVADAAEHLERATVDADGIHNSAKLKLQLFPLDDCTRRIMEAENHNPHLELTLSTRKKISSILDHLNHKWSNSSSSLKELVLFPFWAQGDNPMSYQKWDKSCSLCSGDVYCLIGSPPVFRLRYGWFSKDGIASSPMKTGEKNLRMSMETEKNAEIVVAVDSVCEELLSSRQDADLIPSSTAMPFKPADSSPFSMLISSACDNGTGLALPDDDDNVVVSEQQVDNMKDTELSAGAWADSLTNISMGDLLSESVPIMDIERHLIPSTPFSCDSFDAAIAAHIYKHQKRTEEHVSNVAAIWEAEDTCDGFGFQKTYPLCTAETTASTSLRLNSPASRDVKIKEPPPVAKQEDTDGISYHDDHHPMIEACKDACGVTDMYWPDSLGALDLGMLSCRYSSELILSDSLTGFNGLLANSLDAFQVANESSCQNSLFSDLKIRNEV